MSFFILGARDRIKKDNYLMRLDRLVDWRSIDPGWPLEGDLLQLDKSCS